MQTYKITSVLPFNQQLYEYLRTNIKLMLSIGHKLGCELYRWTPQETLREVKYILHKIASVLAFKKSYQKKKTLRSC